MVECSICLDTLFSNGDDRSTTRRQCGHEFHLDCIGSTFNFKGIMQCPNCGQVERGHWLHASGDVSSEQVNNDDLVFDDHLETFVPLRFLWCPLSRLSELPSLIDEIEGSHEAPFYDVVGQIFNAEPSYGQPLHRIHPIDFHDYPWTQGIHVGTTRIWGVDSGRQR